MPLKYAGQECAACHDDIAKLHDAKHPRVACEVCHGPAAAHVQAPMEVKLPAPRQRAGCPLCHGYDPSRPTGFPQIDPVTHNPLKPCISCHNPARSGASPYAGRLRRVPRPDRPDQGRVASRRAAVYAVP